MSAQTRPSTRAPPSRRGMGASGAFGGLRSGSAFGGANASIANSSRPVSSTSKTSRTHVPSLASHAFFRPMSSQRLQAQRGARPIRAGYPAVGADGTSSIGTNTNRHSLATNATETQEIGNIYDNDVPPPSRGTEFTEQEDRGTITASPTENATLQSAGGSERPLRRHSPDSKALHPRHNQQGNGGPPKTPRSFSANFLKRNGSVCQDSQGHERLSSSNHSQAVSKHPSVVPKAGVNYQYFSGNTIFFWGGRLQNARDRPVNIASGLIVIIPSILFLVYS